MSVKKSRNKLLKDVKVSMLSSSKRRTIVILSAKRCGSTALYKTLVNHSSVKNCQIRGKSRNWEPAFWYHAAFALKLHEPTRLRDQFRKNYAYTDIPDVTCKKDVFEIWDKVLQKRGPIVLDKSPQYLSCKYALDLLLEYMRSGRDVRIIGLIRDPRDAITSQYVKWHTVQERKTGLVDSPERRVEKWLEKYKNLEYFQKYVPDMLMVCYEDFVRDSYQITKLICDYCGIKYQGGMDSHVVPINIGRHITSTNRKIKKWRGNYSSDFKKHLKKYGYV